jgi:hypothetical protein
MARDINDVELGLLNLKNAMRDPSLMKEMAAGLRHPEGRAELIKMMANPKFQEQSKRLADNMKANGVFAAFLEPAFYARKEDASKTLQTVLLALNPAAATRGNAAQMQSRTGSADMSALDELIELAAVATFFLTSHALHCVCFSLLCRDRSCTSGAKFDGCARLGV